jgi:hypothetical protein
MLERIEVDPLPSRPSMSGSRTAATSKLCSQAYAEEALARMKGCHVRIEGIDGCVVAYLMTLTVSEVSGLLDEWHHDYGFPTVSQLVALKEIIDQRCARRTRASGGAA